MDRFHNRMARAAVIASGLFLSNGMAGARTAEARMAAQSETTETVVGVTPDDDDDSRQETVQVAAHELVDQGGRDAVMVRIYRAVRRVCRFDETGTLSERADYEACRETSLADAAGQLRTLVARNGTGPVQIALAEPGR